MLNPEGSRLFPQILVVPRNPGKPDLRWRHFDWRFTDQDIPSGKFRLYFYSDEWWTSEFTLPLIKDQVNYLSKTFNFNPPQRFSYLLFSSHRDFQQANIFNISEGVQGITSTEEATMGIPYWGEKRTFQHISTHEMTHQFQVQKVNYESGDNAQQVMSRVPLWFVEGMAEYFSLHGMDPESKVYIRDLLIHPDPGKDYEPPKFFEVGPMDFFRVYKMGQAKIDFLETEFGKGTALRVLDRASTDLGNKAETFQQVVTTVTGQKGDELEKRWPKYLEKKYKTEADHHQQALESLETIQAAGENLDSFVVSPDGTLIATRQIDPLTGITSIQLIDLNDHDRKTEVTHDYQAGTLSLFFQQMPVLALSNRAIAYINETVLGAELEIREFERDHDGHIELKRTRRIKLHKNGIIEASSPTFSPDSNSIAFVGLNQAGWQNIHVVELSPDSSAAKLRKITEDYYSWHNLSWTSSGILAASDHTEDARYNIFLLDPSARTFKRLTFSSNDQVSPDLQGDRIVYQEWDGDGSQIYSQSIHGGKATRLTDVKTGVMAPVVRGDTLYALGFKSGRYHLYRISRAKLTETSKPGITTPTPQNQGPWHLQLESLPDSQVKPYHPFLTSGARIDGLSGFIGSGSAIGLSGELSDLMRDYSISGDVLVFRGTQYSQFDLFFGKQVGRTKWIFGGYNIAQPRLDSVFSTEDSVRTYLHREFGALGTLRYPIGPFSYADLELRVAGVSRGGFNDPVLEPLWNSQNPGTELLLAPMFRVGWDHILYEAFTGPLSGAGVLLDFDTSYYPHRDSAAQRLRLDGGYYIEIIGRTVLALQSVAGVSFGGRFNNPFFVSSDDIMRAYSFGDARLYGNYLLAGKTELRFPIGDLFKFPPLRGMVSYDVGALSPKSASLFRRVAEAYTFGFGLNIPPISFNFMFSYPIRQAPGPQDSSVFHFTLRYLYL